MSDTTIFIIGAVIFAVSVYGAVMAGGLSLTRTEIDQDPDLGSDVDEAELDKPVPRIEY